MFIKTSRGIVLSLLVLSGVLMASGLPGSAKALIIPGPTPGPIGLVCTTSLTAEFGLQTTAGYISNPDGNSLYMWSYAPASGSFQSPGPTLCVNQDDEVTINLTNYLPEAVSIIFPGQTGVLASGNLTGLFTAEAAGCAGEPPCTPGTATYTFTAGEPGTYLYESGTEPTKQVQMGLKV